MDTIISFLKGLDFFRKVPADKLKQITAPMQVISLNADDTLFEEGEEGDAVYIIIDGTLGIIHKGVQVVTRSVGEMVGEFALIDDHTRSATVTAVSDASLLQWRRADFTAAMAQNPVLLWGILNIMVDKLRESTSAHSASLQMTTAGEPETMTLPGDEWVPEKMIIYRSAPMHRIFALVDRLQNSSSSVLITGESGTGKEVLARAIHARSPGRDGPFVALNCGALPETLAESELFGHEKGAFTGAAQSQKGKIELAHNGTLFLDEVGELPLSLQVKLLRVLDDGRVLRLGGARPVAVNFRVVAATNRDVQKEISEGTFREDLFYRLAVMTIHIPPLRQRLDDIPVLTERFLAEISAQTGQTKSLTPESLDYLLHQPWRGNVRELRNTLERAFMLTEGTQISIAEVEDDEWAIPSDPGIASLTGLPSATVEDLFSRFTEGDQSVNVLEFVEQILIELAMKQADRNMSQAANLLGINYKQVARRLQKYDAEE